MRDAINKFHPTTSWITTALLTLVITTFGVFAQTHANEPDTSLAEVSSSISSHARQLLLVCVDADAVSGKIHYR